MRLAMVTADNVGDACRLAVRPDQERLVTPVAWSLAEAYVQPEVAWPRLVYDEDRLVAFIIWRLNVSAGEQGKGYGRFAVDAVLAEARRRGQRRASVLWVPGPGGPEGFYLRLGFQPAGETFAGQVVGQISLR